MRRLVLVRHGESLWNAEGRMQGQACNGLSPTGHAQAEAAATALAAAYPEARLVSSDLQRTMETVAPLIEALGTEVTADAGLRERSFGSWERRLRRDVRVEEAERWQRWTGGEDVIGEVGGETASRLADRVTPVFLRLLAETDVGDVTIAVTHGGPIWHGTHRLMGFPPPLLGSVANASVTEFVVYGEVDRASGRVDGDLVMDRWNEVAHLPVALRTAWRPARPPVGLPPADVPSRDEVAAG